MFSSFRKECEKLAGKNKKLLEQPPKGLGADLALPCFSFAKNPAETAKDLAKKYSKSLNKKSLIAKIESSGPYVNFHADWTILSEKLVKDIIKNKNEFGAGDKKKDLIILEHTSMNPTGPVHVGRVRNSIIGDCLRRLMFFCGYKVETHYYVNDVGKQVAAIYWAEKNKIPSAKSEEYGKYKNKPDFKTMFQYVAANSELENNPGKMQEVDDIIVSAETGNKKILKGIKSVAANCLEGQKKVLSRLNIPFDCFDFESKYIENSGTKKILAKLRKEKLLKKHEGALGVDLSKYGLERRSGITTLVRSNGTSVYTLRDLAYHQEKLKKGSRAVNVLGEDHKVEFQELKKILHLLNIKKPLDVVHYAFVSFKGMQLSTRRGRTAPLDLLIDEGIEKASMEMKKRNSTTKPEKIAVAAIRYHIIKNDTNKQITFVWDDALRFEGDTGPYLQYTYARAKSILRKAKTKPKAGRLGDEEKEVIKLLAQFPDIIAKAAEQMKPHVVANYISELASSFNEYYHATKVVGSKKEAERLALVQAVSIVLKTGLGLLGIETVEKM